MATNRGQRLRTVRLRHFNSARAAAKALGLPVSSYGAHERAQLPGGRDFNPEDATRYAEFFNTSAEWLLLGRTSDSASHSDHPPEVKRSAVRAKSPSKRVKGLPLLKNWRKYRANMTQVRLGDRACLPEAMISRLENGEIDYTGEVLERLAHALNCEPADLLMRNPLDPDMPWTIWHNLKPAQKKQAVRLLKALANRRAA
jgi:transcriptional regulator with XRE-family HTH domain